VETKSGSIKVVENITPGHFRGGGSAPATHHHLKLYLYARFDNPTLNSMTYYMKVIAI